MYSLKKNGKLTPKEKEEWTVTLKQIAKGLAILFKEESNRKTLEYCIKTSKKVEQILEASEFLNQVYNIEVKGQKKNITFREAIAEVLQENKKADFNEKIKSLKFGLIDLYFPIKEWRKNWHSNNRLQIASIGWNEQLKDVEVFAFASDGTESLIPKNIKPAITTLVVYPSEKRGNYILGNTEKNYYKSLQKFNSIASTNSEGDPEPQTEFRCKGLYVEKDYDSGWFGGDMEIMFKVWKRPIGGNWSSPFFVYIDPDVVAGENGGEWKTENKKIYEYTGTNHEMAFQVLEDDGWLNGWYDYIHDTEWNYLRTPNNILLSTNIVPISWSVSIGYVYDPANNDDLRVDLRCNYLN